MKSYNLLTEQWIPIDNGETISLKTLLCSNNQHWLKLDRDDMEMACLQLVISIVQVVFMPKDKEELIRRYKNPIKKTDYDEYIENFKKWFDLLHGEYPFMQTKDVKEGNYATLQKLFVGLPEKTSISGSSNAFFHRVDEVKATGLGEAAIALFQQATNGLSLGGRAFSCGLKGSMPATTLVYDESRRLRETVWCNVLHKKYVDSCYCEDRNNKPTWVDPISFDKSNPEQACKIGLIRGLFWQPAKVKLSVKDNQAVGFFKETGLSYVKGFWYHPHTPINNIQNFKKQNEKIKPYLSLSREEPLWAQMLGFLYSEESRDEYSRASVVDEYAKGIGKGKMIYLAVGGYIKGKSAESLLGRKHELYCLTSGWEDKYSDFKDLVKSGLDTEKALENSMSILGKNMKWGDEEGEKGQEKSNFIKSLKTKASKMYFDNSETLMHENLKQFDFAKLQESKKAFIKLAKECFENVVHSYENNPKFIKAIALSRQYLNGKLENYE